MFEFEINEHARFFDSESPCWDENPDYNRMFLKTSEGLANHILRKEGKLYLNQVYEMLGLPSTDLGSRYGWSCNSEEGNCQVSFGLIYPTKYDFGMGDSNVFLLDFNVRPLID